jgi:hypothetical protein
MIIKPLITIPGNPEGREERLQALLEGKTTAPGVQEPTTTSPFRIEKTPAGYQVRNIHVNNGIVDILWGNLLPGNGKNSPGLHTQDDWIANPAYRTINKVVYDLPSGPEYANTLLTLYQHRDIPDTTQKKLIHELKDIFRDDFKKYWMMTSTRTAYKPTGDDHIEHARGRSNAYAIDAAVAGANGPFTDSMTTEAKSWLEITNIPEFQEAIKWVTDKDTYLWRIKKPKKNPEERALVLGVIVDRFDVNADYYIGGKGPARGVAVGAKKTP